MTIIYEAERIEHGWRVSAHQDGVFRWRRDYRNVSKAAALASAADDCPKALGRGKRITSELDFTDFRGNAKEYRYGRGVK